MNPNFIILDAARCGLENIYKAKELCKDRHRSLYVEKEFTLLQRVAPYLFEISNNQDFLDWYHQEGLGNSWGILLMTDWNFEATFDHFRRFLKVRKEDDTQLLFRFYDPRVLKSFLPTCNADQLKHFFGKLDGIFLEDEQQKSGEIYSLSHNLLIKKTMKFN